MTRPSAERVEEIRRLVGVRSERMHAHVAAVHDLLAEIDALRAERSQWASSAGRWAADATVAEDRAAVAEAGLGVSETIRRFDGALLLAVAEATRDACASKFDPNEAADGMPLVARGLREIPLGPIVGRVTGRRA